MVGRGVLPGRIPIVGLALAIALAAIGAVPQAGLVRAASTTQAHPAVLAPTPAGKTADPRQRAAVSARYGRLPLSFEPNLGQADVSATFLARGAGYGVDILPTGAVVRLVKPAAAAKDAILHPRSAALPPAAAAATVHLLQQGGNPQAKVVGVDQLPGKSNVFVGKDPATWRAGIPTYAKVKLEGIYPGIDLVYYGTQQGLEYDYIVAPGADPHQIHMGFQGQDSSTQSGNGDLVLHTSAGDLTERAPVASQGDGATKRSVAAHLVVTGSTATVALGTYDPTRALVIDPATSYTDYVGGSGSDIGNAIAIDSAGNAYVAGSTTSTNFPTSGPYQATNAGGTDGFVYEINAAGTQFVYSTYLGGTGDDQVNGLALDASNNVVLAGQTTSSNFPTLNPYQAIYTGNGISPSGFVTKLNASGAALVFSTYLEGTSNPPYGPYSIATALALDSNGAAYVTGYVGGADFPTVNAFQPTNHAAGSYNAFVTKLNPSGSSLAYSSYLGGSGTAGLGDYGHGIAVDSSGAAYLVGGTGSTDFPTVNAYQATNHSTSGGQNSYVTKVAPSGSSLIYSTYLGGASSDQALGIAVDSSDHAYVAGATTSHDFPTINAVQGIHGCSGTCSGADNCFVTEFATAGTSLTYSTYLGGNNQDYCTGITVDAGGSAYVSGQAGSSNFPTVNPYQAQNPYQDQQGMVAVINPTGPTLTYSSYLGLSNADLTKAIATDGVGDVYVTGFTYYPGNQTTLIAKLPTSPIGGPVTADSTYGPNNGCIPCARGAHAQRVDPVDTATGNFTQSFTDISIPGRGFPLLANRTYNALASSTDGPLGYGWTSSYAMALAVVGSTATVTQEGGAQVTFTQSGGSYTAPPRVIATLAHNGDGTYTLTRRAQETFTFSATGQLTGETDLNGYATTLTYTGGLLTRVTDAAGRWLTLAYTGSHLSSVTDANITPNRTVTFAYNDGAGNLTDVTDVNAGNTHYTYDTSHRMLTWRDPRGNTVTNHYDGAGRVDWQKDQLNQQTTFVYATAGLDSTTTMTDPVGHVTVDQYLYGLRTQVTRGYGTPQAATTRYGYDPTTLGMTSMRDPNGNVSTVYYDQSGNALYSTDALYRTTSRTFNAFNEPLTVQDGNGITTTNTYDAHGNPLTSSRPVSGTACPCQVTTYNRSDASHPGDVTSMVDPDGKSWSYGYNGNGDRVETRDPLGNTSALVFNADGWIAASYTPKAGCIWGSAPPAGCSSAYQTTYSYIIPNTSNTNEFGDVQTITDPLGHVTTYGYDADRHKTSVKDGNGNLTTSVYDAANEMTQTRRADNPQTTLVTDYNPDGSVADQKDGAGNTIQSYGYDSRARVTTVTVDPGASPHLNQATNFTYDGDGNRLSKQDPGGNCGGTPSGCTTMTYDADNELKTVTYSDGVTPNVTSITYDGDGQRTGTTDGTGSSTWAWDNLHRLTSSTNGNGATVGYSYNLRNLATTITYPGNHAVSRGFDDAGRLGSVQDWLATANTTSFSYDANSNLTSDTFQSGAVDTYAFNAADQLTAISDVKTPVTIFSASYARDNNGQLATDSSVPAATGAYQYTALNQLCYAGSANSAGCSTPPTGSQPYGFDAADNLTKNNLTIQQFNTANELCWTVPGSSANGCGSAPAGATTYSYDSRGNQTGHVPGTGAATCQSYDQANRLTRIQTGTGSSCTSPATVGSYGYDGTGLRMSKTTGTTTTQFAWDQSGSLPQLLDEKAGAGTPTYYIYGPGGLPVEQIDSSGGAHFYHHDQLGSTRAISSTAGATENTYTYDPYGNLTASTGTVPNPLRFSGQYQDAEGSGLYYLRARYYDPTTAQFLSRDPAVATTRSPYAYVAGNPLNGIDPSGLFQPGGFVACGTTVEIPVAGETACGYAVGETVVEAAAALATLAIFAWTNSGGNHSPPVDSPPVPLPPSASYKAPPPKFPSPPMPRNVNRPPGCSFNFGPDSGGFDGGGGDGNVSMSPSGDPEPGSGGSSNLPRVIKVVLVVGGVATVVYEVVSSGGQEGGHR